MGNVNSIKYKHIFKKPKVGNYIVKIDDLQIDRIHQQHYVFKSYCNGNFTSPISEDLARGIEVLDIGSGPGTWIFDMSSEFQKSNFMGVEIQAFMLPTIHPSNTRFVYSDALGKLPFDRNSFDYIHMRNMTLSFTESQYQQVVKNLAYLLKPNGFLELCEVELEFYNMGPITKRLNDATHRLMKTKSMNPHLNNRLHEFMNNVGLQQIQQNDIMIPFNALDGEAGSLMGESIVNVVVALKDPLAKQMNISYSEMDGLIDQLRAETKSIKMSMKYTRIYGKKSSVSNA